MSMPAEEDDMRLKRRKEFWAHCSLRENEVRRSLAEAVASTKRAKERYEEFFLACEKRSVGRKESL